MNIILLEKIKKLGNIGEEVTVKSGYARNFLVPNNKALYATPENRKYFEDKKTEINTQNENLIRDAKEKLKKLSGQEVILIRAASDTGQLFGSVSTKDIVNYLAKKNISILKSEIDLNKSVKTLTYEKVTVNLHPEVSCEIILNVARSSEEASKQKQIGQAVTSNSDKEDVKKEANEELPEKNEPSTEKQKKIGKDVTSISDKEDAKKEVKEELPEKNEPSTEKQKKNGKDITSNSDKDDVKKEVNEELSEQDGPTTDK